MTKEIAGEIDELVDKIVKDSEKTDNVTDTFSVGRVDCVHEYVGVGNTFDVRVDKHESGDVVTAITINDETVFVSLLELALIIQIATRARACMRRVKRGDTWDDGPVKGV